MIDIKNSNAAAIAAQMASTTAKNGDTTAFEKLMSSMANQAREADVNVSRRDDYPHRPEVNSPAGSPSRSRIGEGGVPHRPEPATSRPETMTRPEKTERPERPEPRDKVETNRPGKPEATGKDEPKAIDEKPEKETTETEATTSGQVGETENTEGKGAVEEAATAVTPNLEEVAAGYEVAAETGALEGEIAATPVEGELAATAEEEPSTVPEGSLEVAPEEASTTETEPVKSAEPEVTIDGADIAADLKAGKAVKPAMVGNLAGDTVNPGATPTPEALAAAAVAGQVSGNTSGAGTAGSAVANAGVSGVSGTTSAIPIASAAPAVAPAVTTANPVSQSAPVFAPNLSQQLFDQMQHQLSRLKALGQGQHQLKLAINPETFGPVRVAANFHADGTVHLQLLGASEAARDQLRQVLSDLRRDLASTGLQADLDVAEDAAEFAQFTQAGRDAEGDGSGRGGQGSVPGTTDGTGTEGEEIVTRPQVGDILKDGTDGSVDMFA